MKISCLKETVGCCYRKQAVILTTAVPALLHTQPGFQVTQQDFILESLGCFLLKLLLCTQGAYLGVWCHRVTGVPVVAMKLRILFI